MAESEKTNNLRLGEALCAELLRSGTAASAVVGAAGTNAAPDLLIVVDGAHIVVELTGYRHPGAHKRAERDEELTSKAIEEFLEADATMRGFSLNIDYQSGRTSAGDHWYLVPKKSERARVVAETGKMLSALRPTPLWGSGVAIHVSFDPPEYVDAMNSAPGCSRLYFDWSMDATAYPALARHCRSIAVQPAPTDAEPVVNSTFNIRGIAGVVDVVRELVKNKMGRLVTYREKAKGGPCWLVIHSGGYPMSAMIDRKSIPEMCRIAREELDGKNPSFDRAFWLELRAPVGARRLYSIVA